MVDYLDQFELNVCLRVNALSRRELVRRFFSVVSWLGDYPAWLLLGVAVAVRQDVGALDFVAVAVATGLAGVLIYKALKERLVRERRSSHMVRSSVAQRRWIAIVFRPAIRCTPSA